MEKNKFLTHQKSEELLKILKTRFGKNMHRHDGFVWSEIEDRLEKSPEKLRSLFRMEETGGEPDVVGYDPTTGEYIFCDCSAESPKGRRSVCYDQQALESRKEFKPANSALGMASEMGIEILSEEKYRDLQKLEKFDTKTSSWILTPSDIRAKGGALFCDYRYGHVFVYHNGAESYYGARGFRGLLRV
jgi:hypothetical protein